MPLGKSPFKGDLEGPVIRGSCSEQISFVSGGKIRTSQIFGRLGGNNFGLPIVNARE